MKFIDSIMEKFGFTRIKNSNARLINFLDGNGAIFNQYGQSIYASDVVQQAIYSIVTEIKKAIPTHVKQLGGDINFVNDQIQKVLDNPNPLMTTCDYIEKIMWNLFFNDNAFVYPKYINGSLVSLTPLQPTTVEFINYSNGIFVHMIFANGYETEIPYDRLIHIRRKYSVNDVMGGNEKGQPDHRALEKTLQLNDMLIDGLAKSLKMQTKVNAVMKFKSQVNSESQMKWLQEFERKLDNYDNAILPTDLANEFVPINKQIALLDQTTLDFIDKKILRTFGVPLCVVEGDFKVEQYNAFYQKTLEPILISIEQAHTKALFTNKESFGYGHKIKFYPEDLISLNMDQKIEYFKVLVDTGSCYKNELRTTFGMRPDSAFNNQLAVSSNKQNAENNTEGGGGISE